MMEEFDSQEATSAPKQLPPKQLPPKQLPRLSAASPTLSAAPQASISPEEENPAEKQNWKEEIRKTILGVGVPIIDGQTVSPEMITTENGNQTEKDTTIQPIVHESRTDNCSVRLNDGRCSFTATPRSLDSACEPTDEILQQ